MDSIIGMSLLPWCSFQRLIVTEIGSDLWVTAACIFVPLTLLWPSNPTSAPLFRRYGNTVDGERVHLDYSERVSPRNQGVKYRLQNALLPPPKPPPSCGVAVVVLGILQVVPPAPRRGGAAIIPRHFDTPATIITNIMMTIIGPSPFNGFGYVLLFFYPTYLYGVALFPPLHNGPLSVILSAEILKSSSIRNIIAK